jgi:hypothetical protein
MTDPRPIHSDQRFVMHGLAYVASAVAFMVLAVTTGVILGSRMTEYPTSSLGIAVIAMLFLVVGNGILTTFLLRHWRSMQKPSRPGCYRRSSDLWDAQIDS